MKLKTTLFTAISMALALAGSASAVTLLTDNFTVTGTTNTYNLNFNVAGRQGGTQAGSQWTGLNNAQVGNSSVFGSDGNYLMVADANARATLGTLNLASLVPSNQRLVISFNAQATVGGAGWTSFTLGNLVSGQTYGVADPNVAAVEFGFIYRSNSVIQAFDNGAMIQGDIATTGTEAFTFTFADLATGLASPFGVANAQVTIQKGATTIGTYTLAGGLTSNTYITFGTGSGGWASGGRGLIDNLVVQTVPEPSAAILGGLGVLALLRRRR